MANVKLAIGKIKFSRRQIYILPSANFYFLNGKCKICRWEISPPIVRKEKVSCSANAVAVISVLRVPET